MNKITEPNQAADALRESETHKGAILESVLDCIISIDHEGKIIEFNPAAETTFGYTRAKVIGKELAETIVPPSLREAHRRGLARYLATGEGPILGKRIEITAMRADGSEFPTELAIVPIDLGEQPIFTAYLRDITEHKRAEEELKDGERRLAEAQQLSHLGSWEWDIPTNTVVWSDELHRIYGISPEDFSASYEGFLECVHPEDRERVRKIVEDSYLHKKPLDYYHRIVRPDGTVRTLHARGGVVVDDAGNLIRMLGTGLDVTELQQAEEEIRKLNAELERRVQERTAELEDALHQLRETQNQLILQEKMASLGALTAGIAHEIKNPLNFVNNFAELSTDLVQELHQEIQTHKEKLDDEAVEAIAAILSDLQQNTTKINEHGQRANSIINGMLLHSRGKSGDPQPTDINGLLAEDINLAYHGMRAKDTTFNIGIETDYDDSIERIEIVPQDISRVFLNVINNACYATHQKKKAVGEGFTPTLSVRTKAGRNQVEIRIRDNGPGIPKDVVDKIFNPFFTTKPTGEGTGLGLSISYEIVVEEHNGAIQVETEAGSYTEFIITLPIPHGGSRKSDDGT